MSRFCNVYAQLHGKWYNDRSIAFSGCVMLARQASHKYCLRKARSFFMTTAAAAPQLELDLHEASGLAYLAGGAGLPLVFLHGWDAFKELWLSTLYALAPHYRVVAPDLPGHGASPPPPVADIGGLAAQLSLFCRDHGLAPLTLVGHSMGGNIALELALREPQLVRRLVLVAPAVDPAQLPAYVQMYTTPGYGWALLRMGQVVARVVLPLSKRVAPLHRGGWLRPWLRRSAYTTLHDPLHVRSLLDALFRNPLMSRLPAVDVPILVVSGQFDGLVPPEHSRRVAQTLPQAQYVEIAGALHNPMDERPQAFEQALLTFLRATDDHFAQSEPVSDDGDGYRHGAGTPERD